ncbi:MAG: molybdopterin molybdotransferase MoeA [Gammaproteobacteria bacterium]|nr:molybdopterin molybdotransferase MoeA [Gammaproteobacteria bacterium]MBD3775912.1 molybdopterin molybdotransferase MoeA [Thiotrichales bacterium]
MLQKNHKVLSQYDAVKSFVLSQVKALQETERVTLNQLVGRVLAEEVVSPLNLPGWPQSAMDGYAFSSTNQTDFMPVVDTIYAGQMPPSCFPADAVRIMTGAMLPEGFDTVVPFEEAAVRKPEMNERVGRESGQGFEHLSNPVHLRRGYHVKTVGSDVKLGDVLLPKGHVVKVREIGLLASVGIRDVLVLRKPRVLIMTSGDELLVPGDAYSIGGVYDANSFQIAALCESLGVEVVAVVHASDSQQIISELFQDWSEKVDLIMTLGGSSVGHKDHIKSAMLALHESWAWKLAMKPAKPFAFAKLDQALILALPGNPLAAFMSFKLFAEEVLRKLSGASEWQALAEKVRILQAMPSGEKVRWVQVCKNQDGVMPVESGSASRLSVLHDATGYIRLESSKPYEINQMVEYWSYGCQHG